MTTYRLASNGIIKNDSSFVPNDPLNADWRAYQAWLTEGNKPEPYVAPETPVETIRVAYLVAALAQVGKLVAVNAAVTDPVLAALWAKATEIRRDDPDMAAVAAALSIDLDDVWARARAIRAARGGG